MINFTPYLHRVSLVGFGGIDLFRSICIQPAHHKSYVWASAMSVLTCLFPTHVLVLGGYRWMLLSTLSAVCAPYAPLTTITRRGTTITRNYLSLYLLSTWYIRLFITPAVQAPVFTNTINCGSITWVFGSVINLNIKTIFYREQNFLSGTHCSYTPYHFWHT